LRFENFSFGSIRIDGETYDYDLVIDRGEIQKRKKKASKPYREAFKHTPLSVKENIPWRCSRLVIGTGAEGLLPVMDEVRDEARERKVQLISVPTPEAIAILNRGGKATNAVLHVTC
jgi:hypothetical protein